MPRAPTPPLPPTSRRRRARRRAGLPAAAAAACLALAPPARGQLLGGTPAPPPAACVAATPDGAIDISRMQPLTVGAKLTTGWRFDIVFAWCDAGGGRSRAPPGAASLCRGKFSADGAPDAGGGEGFYAAMYTDHSYGYQMCSWAFGKIETGLWYSSKGSAADADPPSGPDLTKYSAHIVLSGGTAAAAAQQASFPMDVARRLNVTLLCNPQLGNTIQPSIAMQQSGVRAKGIGTVHSPITYTAEFETGWACPGTALQPPSEGGGGLTWGAYFLIAFFCGAAVYLVAGAAFNYQARGRRGVQVIPNLEQWQQLPGLVRDGVVFSARRITGRGDGYAQV